MNRKRDTIVRDAKASIFLSLTDVSRLRLCLFDGLRWDD